MELTECLSLQLTEIDMLSSMFPTEGELKLDDPISIIVIKDFVDGKITYNDVRPRIGFVLKFESSETKSQLELVTHLPHEYPAVVPEVFVRSEGLSKAGHRMLNNDLLYYIHNDVDREEICICNIVQWLQEHAEEYIKASKDLQKQVKKRKEPKQDKVFCRMWIYSHHIYSKIKRKDILELTSDLNLSGFCMPGKPGIIAIEGYNNCVEEFWGTIRRWQWKRLVMKEKEDFEISTSDNKNLDCYRKFTGFEEKYFEPRLAKGRGAHGDRGLLFQFLEDRGCGHIFQYYFGVEGRSVEQDSDGD